MNRFTLAELLTKYGVPWHIDPTTKQLHIDDQELLAARMPAHLRDMLSHLYRTKGQNRAQRRRAARSMS